MGPFRFAADLRTMLFTCTYFGLVTLLWVWSPTNLAIVVPLMVLTCFFSFFGAVATHNTVHCPVFKPRWMNRVFQVVLTLTYGHPVSSFVPGHNLSHHKHTQTRRDVMRTTKMRYRWNLLNGLLFLFHIGGDVMKGDLRYFKAMKGRHPVWYRQMVIEWGTMFLIYGVLIALDWQKFLLYVFLPHKYAAWGIITMNLLQHDGCDADSKYNHSRNFVGKVVNFFTYNNGFHSIHHKYPGLHWSLTPAAHAEQIAPHIHPNLDQPSLLAYLWRTFGWPGKRVTYLGEPVVLPPEGPDEEWVPTPKETPDDLGAIA